MTEEQTTGSTNSTSLQTHGSEASPPEAAQPDAIPDAVELSNAVYRDIVLADAKAAFAMTIAGLGIAGTASFFGSTPDQTIRSLITGSAYVYVPIGLGVLASLAAVFCAATTVLPRRYVRGHNDPSRPKTWPRWQEWPLVWLPWLHVPFDGASDSFDHLFNSMQRDNPDKAKFFWFTEIGRQVEVRRRKYWWVGLSIVFALASTLFMIVGVGVAVKIASPITSKVTSQSNLTTTPVP